MASISENTQTDFDNAEAVVIDMLQTVRPGISLRKGTVLRELLVRPVAEMYAADTRRVEESMESRSLALMRDSGNATTEDVNAILSNFSTTLYEGKNASGFVFVQVASDSTYSIPADTVFSTEDGRNFLVSDSYVATSANVSGDSYLALKQTNAGAFYFLVPVEAESVGSDYELDSGVPMSVDPEFPGLVSAFSYGKFSGGLNAQTVSEAIADLESSVSVRGFDSRLSIKATLLDKNAGNFAGTVLDCNSVGFGDAEQIRDKSNVFGISTGGKIDVFVRSYSTPPVVSFRKTGVSEGGGKYAIRLFRHEVPGYYAVRGVFDPGSVQTGGIAANRFVLSGSYPVSDSFTDAGYPHSSPSVPAGLAYSAYRDVTLLVSTEDEEPAGTQREFDVSLYASPQVAAVQDYVDREDVKSLKGDMLVRLAPFCLVGIRATVGVPAGFEAPDVPAMKKAVADYINGRNFTSRLTASEIIAVLSDFDVSRVEMLHDPRFGFRMSGRLRNASGDIVYFHGPDLDVAAKADPANLVSPKTVCFCTDIGCIDIELVGDK